MFVSNKVDSRFFTENMILDEMKIAIPTKDGKQIGTSFKNSPYYKIFKIKNGQIQHYNVVRNELGNNILDDSELLKTNLYGKKCIEECFCDCQVVIIRKIDHQSWYKLGHMGIEVIQTEEKEIEESVQKYLEGALIDKYNVQ